MKLANLARLKPDKKTEKQVESILKYMGKLNEVDTKDTFPFTHFEKGHLREDIVKESLPVEEVLKNAPHREGDYFCVPLVIDIKKEETKLTKDGICTQKEIIEGKDYYRAHHWYKKNGEDGVFVKYGVTEEEAIKRVREKICQSRENL